MTMMRTGLAGLAAAVLALPLAAPREAHAQDFTPDLYTCAALYDVLDTNKRDRVPRRGVTEAGPPRMSGSAGLVSVRGLPAG